VTGAFLGRGKAPADAIEGHAEGDERCHQGGIRIDQGAVEIADGEGGLTHRQERERDIRPR
jgi:hypothetical protein